MTIEAGFGGRPRPQPRTEPYGAWGRRKIVGNTAKAAARAVYGREIRKFIAQHPGCSTAEIWTAMQALGHEAHPSWSLTLLVKLKMIRFSFPHRVGRSSGPQCWTVVAMEEPEDDKR